MNGIRSMKDWKIFGKKTTRARTMRMKTDSTPKMDAVMLKNKAIRNYYLPNPLIVTDLI
jgi:hypothetical protein